MSRITISLDPEIEKILLALQQGLAQVEGKSWSVSKIVNIVLLGGLVGASEITSFGWGTIRSLLEGGAIKLDTLIVQEYVGSLMALKQLA